MTIKLFARCRLAESSYSQCRTTVSDQKRDFLVGPVEEEKSAAHGLGRKSKRRTASSWLPGPDPSCARHAVHPSCRSLRRLLQSQKDAQLCLFPGREEGGRGGKGASGRPFARFVYAGRVRSSVRFAVPPELVSVAHSSEVWAVEGETGWAGRTVGRTSLARARAVGVVGVRYSVVASDLASTSLAEVVVHEQELRELAFEGCRPVRRYFR